MFRAPPLPKTGSVVYPGVAYLCLGRWGKGTFCAVHNGSGRGSREQRRRRRFVVASVELGEFVNSWVIDEEAAGKDTQTD